MASTLLTPLGFHTDAVFEHDSGAKVYFTFGALANSTDTAGLTLLGTATRQWTRLHTSFRVPAQDAKEVEASEGAGKPAPVSRTIVPDSALPVCLWGHPKIPSNDRARTGCVAAAHAGAGAAAGVWGVLGAWGVGVDRRRRGRDGVRHKEMHLNKQCCRAACSGGVAS